MVEQIRANLSNVLAIRSGDSFATTGATVKQDAGRLIDLAIYTIMARLQVTATSITPNVGNTGDGTFTAFALAQGAIPIPGAWNLECIVAVATGGIFKLEDPNGIVVASNLVLNVGAAAVTVFTVAGMTVTVTIGAADFIVGDDVAIVITADGDYVPLAADGVGGAQRVAGILLTDTIPVATVVAGDVANQGLLLGGVCTFTKDLAVVDDPAGAVTDLLPSGLTIEEELALLGIFLEDTVNISNFENS